MIHLDEAVASIESVSSAEIVIVLAPLSDEYQESALLAGCLVSLSIFFLAYFSPYIHPPLVIGIEMILAGALCRWLAFKLPRLLRILTTSNRRDRAVKRSARVAFFNQNVASTAERTGVLFYYSALEDQLEVLADSGVHQTINAIEFAKFRKTFTEKKGDTEARLLESLRAMKSTLGEHLPRSPEDQNELPDRAVILRGAP